MGDVLIVGRQSGKKLLLTALLEKLLDGSITFPPAQPIDEPLFHRLPVSVGGHQKCFEDMNRRERRAFARARSKDRTP